MMGIGLFAATTSTALADVVDYGPVGMHREVRQIALRFSDEMVALGDDHAPDAASVHCVGTNEKPIGHWIDGRRWVMEFGSPLKDGVVCDVTPKPLHTLAGVAVSTPAPWKFDTGGPRLLQKILLTGADGLAKEDPILILQTSAIVDKASLNNLTCSVNNREASIKLLQGKDQEDALKKSPLPKPVTTPDNQLVIQCGTNPWPANAKIDVVWGAKIASVTGSTNERDDKWNFKVRPLLTGRASCTQLWGTPGCEPRHENQYQPNLILHFSDFIPNSLVSEIKLIGASGTSYPGTKAYNWQNQDGAQDINFSGNFAKETSLELSLPDKLADMDGRPLTNEATLKHTIAIATLPPYLGMPKENGVLPWAPGKTANWPVATRNLESTIPARAWRFSPATDTTTLIRLQGLVSGVNVGAEGLTSADLAKPYAVSQHILSDFQGVSRQEEQKLLKLKGKEADFTNLPLQGYGTWLVEADSPAYRQAVELQHQLLVKQENGDPKTSENTLKLQSKAIARVEILPSTGLPKFIEAWANSRYAIVQLTNLHVEFLKSTRGESLLWVTAFDTGRPVAGASVEVWGDDKRFSGVTDEKGRLSVPNTANFNQTPATREPVMLVVRHDDDVVLTNFERNGYYDSMGFQGRAEPDLIVHSILDRVLLHPGETVSMQHIARNQTAQGMSLPTLDKGWQVNIYQDYCYSGVPVVHQQALNWLSDGSATSDWIIPNTAKLGQYCYQVLDPSAKMRETGSFQVEEFRTPSFDAAFHIEGKWLDGHQSLTLEPHLSFMTSGAAVGKSVILEGRYQFAQPNLDWSYTFFPEIPQGMATPDIVYQSVFIDKSGQATYKFPAPKFAWPLEFKAQMSFADPDGEIQSRVEEYTVWPQPHKFGMRFQTVQAGKPIMVDVRGFDENDKPLQRENVDIYLIDPQQRASLACSAITDGKGKASCTLTDKKLDELKGWSAEVRAKGASGVTLKIGENIPNYNWFNQSQEQKAFELANQEAPQIGAPLQLRIRSPFLPATALVTVEREGILANEVFDLNKEEEIVTLPTSSADAPSVQVRLTLAHGTDAHATNGNDNHPGAWNMEIPVLFASTFGSINVNVKPVQSIVMPGAKLPVKIHAKFDSDGKPAAHAHVTLVAADDSLMTLKPNSTWSLLQAYWTQSHTDTHPAGSSADSIYAPSALERTQFIGQLERLLDFSFGIEGMNAEELRQFMDRFGERFRRADVDTPAPAPEPRAVAAVEIAGSKIEAPMAAFASAGQFDSSVDTIKPRTNFSTLAIWKTDIVLDANGDAEVTIPFPDSLTRWRIAAIATSGAYHFGTGEAPVVTKLPVQIISGISPTVRSDDVLTQQLTLRNTTDKSVHVSLHAEARGTRDADTPGARDSMPANALATRGLKFRRELDLAAHENKIVDWQSAVPDGLTELTWAISAQDRSGQQLDALEITQRVVASVPVTVREASLVHIDHPQSLTIAQPAGAKPGRGGVAIKWKNSLVNAAMDGTKRWMEQYPFTCMEQLTSKAVVNGAPVQWEQIVAKLPGMTDNNNLVRYFPETPGSDVLTAYLLDIADAYGLTIPPEQMGRMKAGLRDALRNPVTSPQQWMAEDLLVPRRLALQAAIAPDLADIAPTIPEDIHALPTNALLDWMQYVLKLPDSAQRKKWEDAASMELLDRFDMQGTRLTLRHNAQDNWWWFMWNEDVANARAVLLVERYLKNEPRWHDLTASMVASLVDRQHGGHWRTTVANAWAGAALRAFAKDEEHGPVSGTASATFGAVESKVTWPEPSPTLLPWPQQGAREKLTLEHQGEGAPWATVQVLAAVDTSSAVSHGLAIKRSIEPVQQKTKGHWSVGDVMRIKLALTSDADLSWLAVRDPIPSGSTILGKGIAGESVLNDGHAGQWWWRPGSVEMGSESYRGYYEHVWAGTWEVSYLVRLNNAGQFLLPPTRVEAMYAPEIFGELPNAPLKVEP